MGKIIYFNFLLFFTILFQGIGVFSEENIEKSWNLHIRQKRLSDKSPNGNSSRSIVDVPYIVNILINGVPNCAGSILTPSVVLTAAHCVFRNHLTYSILSGSECINRGKHHNVTNKLIFPHYNPHTRWDDIALVVIWPHIDLIHSHNRKIELHKGNVPKGTFGVFSGWGSMSEPGLPPKYPTTLQSIIVPVISQKLCTFFYDTPGAITDKDICTFDKKREKYGGDGDSGNPLVVGDGRHDTLIGVMAWSGSDPNKENPDVFMKVSHDLYRKWIVSNIKIIQGYF